MSTSLAESLKRETRLLHTQVERSDFMRRLLRGQMDLTGYCALLRNLHAIYASLEVALDRSSQLPLLASLCTAELRREPSLRHDLEALCGTGWQDIPLQATTRRYVARLIGLAADQPELLVAHSYVRYLGDLNGGQLLGRIVRDSIVPQRPQLQAIHSMAQSDIDSGTAFYSFGNAAETAALKQRYRDALDALSPDPATADAVVAEAVLAFELHSQLFAELSENTVKA